MDGYHVGPLDPEVRRGSIGDGEGVGADSATAHRKRVGWREDKRASILRAIGDHDRDTRSHFVGVPRQHARIGVGPVEPRPTGN